MASPVVVSGDKSESSKWAVPIVVVVVLGAAAAGGVWFVRRRRKAVSYHGLKEAEMGAVRRDY